MKRKLRALFSNPNIPSIFSEDESQSGQGSVGSSSSTITTSNSTSRIQNQSSERERTNISVSSSDFENRSRHDDIRRKHADAISSATDVESDVFEFDETDSAVDVEFPSPLSSELKSPTSPIGSLPSWFNRQNRTSIARREANDILENVLDHKLLFFTKSSIMLKSY